MGDKNADKLTKRRKKREAAENASLDRLVPADHLLRKIDAAIDFNRIYEFVDDLYCKDNGRPGVDPVVLFKIVMIRHIYGIPSLRRTLEEINTNVAYRWFVGYSFNEQAPHFLTVSYNLNAVVGIRFYIIVRVITPYFSNEGRRTRIA